jgi:HAD superfamily hydrolase (TIGR01509 family)
VDALIFDFDGTILDTEWPVYRSIADQYEAHGHELTIERWQVCVGTDDDLDWFAEIEAHVGRPLDRASIEATRRARRNELLAAESIRAGVVALLDAAATHGVPVAIASSSPLDWVMTHLGSIGLADRFPVISAREHVAAAKPAPDLYLAATAALGVAPARAVAIEDSRNGCLAAKAAGLACVVVPNRITATMDFSPADLVLDSLALASLSTLSALLHSPS